MGANLGVQESAQAGAGAWEWLTVENITLNAADASISVYLRVDTGTAYFTMPMLTVGPEAQPWKPRGMKYRSTYVQQAAGTTGDIAWSDQDCTANTNPLACLISVYAVIKEPDGTIESAIVMAHNDALPGGDQVCYVVLADILNRNIYGQSAVLACDDSQVLRYYVDEKDADSDVTWYIRIIGYWIWE